MIQLYNVSATNRLNLLANSTPQKTITVVEASLKVVIMLPFRVPGLASQLRQEKWELFFIFLLLHSLGIWTVKMVKHWDTREKREGWDWGSKNSNRKNDKGFVNYALWEGKFSETKWSKGWSRGNELRGREEGASVNHCYCVWELNVITFFVSFVYLHPSVAQFMASWQKRSQMLRLAATCRVL